MTTDTDTAEALEAAIDAIACRRCDHDDPIGSTDRSALHRAIAAHVEAEVARRLAAAPEVEAAIVDYALAAQGDFDTSEEREALRAAIAADKARAVEAEATRRDAEIFGLRARARPTPDEARRLVDEYDRATRNSYVTGGPEALRAARTALVAAIAPQPQPPAASEARRSVEALHLDLLATADTVAALHGAVGTGLRSHCVAAADKLRLTATDARTALLRALGVEA